MEDFTAYELKTVCKAETGIILPSYNGSTIRGAFFSALRHDFCLNKNIEACVRCPAAEVCPICRLVATVEWDSERGVEIPRPFVLKPVIGGKTQFEAGETFSFGITLFGKSLSLFPYAILAMQRMGEIGMGNRKLAPGRFILQKITIQNTFTGEEHEIFSFPEKIVRVPDLAITNSHILSFSVELDPKRVFIEFITPLRLITEGSLVKKLTFRIFMQRILRRLTDLYNSYVLNGKVNQEEPKKRLELAFPALLEQTEKIQVEEDKTEWIDLSSYSSRRQAKTPIGGLIGTISFTGNLSPFLPLLAWGQVVHVGKDTTRGNGWYEIKKRPNG